MSRFARLSRWSTILRYCFLPVLICFSFLSTPAFPLGFGEVKLHSYINEPMDAEIELLGAENYEPERILVSLASAQEFKRAGLARPFLLSQLQFQVLRTMPTTVIRVTSHEPIRQPYLEFLIDLSWPGGRLVRGYTLLLDPAPAGTVPLHVRRPPVVSRGIKEKVISTQAVNTVNTVNAVDPVSTTNAVNTANAVNTTHNFSQYNTMPGVHQDGISQNTIQTQNAHLNQNTTQTKNMLQSNQNNFSQHIQNSPVILSPTQPVANTHQQRFEKLFDGNADTNMQNEIAPMTIVSALPENPQQSVYSGSQYQNNNSFQGTANNQNIDSQQIQGQQQQQQQQQNQQSNTNIHSRAQTQALAAQQQIAQQQAQQVVQQQKNVGTNVDKLFTYEKMQWLLVFIGVSILLACITLIIVLIRRNEFKNKNVPVNDVSINALSVKEIAADKMKVTDKAKEIDKTKEIDKEKAIEATVSAAVYGTSLNNNVTSTNSADRHLQEDLRIHERFQERFEDRFQERIQDRFQEPFQDNMRISTPLNMPIINEMTMKLELAKKYFEIGDDENALTLLEDVSLRGTEWEKQTAQRLLTENAVKEMA